MQVEGGETITPFFLTLIIGKEPNYFASWAISRDPTTNEMSLHGLKLIQKTRTVRLQIVSYNSGVFLTTRVSNWGCSSPFLRPLACSYVFWRFLTLHHQTPESQEVFLALCRTGGYDAAQPNSSTKPMRRK
jgi:hypothetical protein